MRHRYLNLAPILSQAPGAQIVTANRTVSHPVLQLQAVLGNQAVNQIISAQSQSLQQKPVFAGLSQSLVHDLWSQHQTLLTLKAGGKNLPDGVQQRMETAFGADFSDVRIHEGPEAEVIEAEAFTHGHHIYFARGKYNPSSLDGQRLLGHELTHVIQQRVGRVTRPSQPGLPINTDSYLEAEADRMGAKAASGESVAMPSTNPGIGGSTQGAPVQLLKKKKFEDADLDTSVPVQNAIAGGAINQVDLVTYKQLIGTGTRTGFFKADFKKQKRGKEYVKHDIGQVALDIGIDEKNPKLANRAVATSRIASLLKNQYGGGPGSIIAETAFASHKRNGKSYEGSVSEKAGGRPLKVGVDVEVVNPGLIKGLSGLAPDGKPEDYMYETTAGGGRGKQVYRPGDATKKLHVTQKQNPNGPDEYENPNAFYKIDQNYYYHRFNFQDPQIQQGLSDLQILDAITGQVDRHGGNIFIDNNGKVTGIDNDAAFGKAISNPTRLVSSGRRGDRLYDSHNKGLPPLVDVTTAEMVLGLDPKTVKKELKGLLSREEIQATIDRLNVVKQHIRDLYAKGGVVGADPYTVGNAQVHQPLLWGQGTYNTTMAAGPDSSYLGHAATRYAQEALKGPQYAEGAPIPAPLPIVANVNPAPVVAPSVVANPNQAVQNASPQVLANVNPVSVPVSRRQLTKQKELERKKNYEEMMKREKAEFEKLSPEEWKERQRKIAAEKKAKLAAVEKQ